jgi:hypothetical protein
MTLPVYITGTVSVSNLGTVVTGTGCMWSGINAREGDFFTRPDGVAIITEVTDATHLKITPWPGATIAGGTYAIQQNYVGRVVGVAAAEDVGVMLEKLHTDGLPFIVGTDETVPDPSYGDEGQMAFKPDTGEWWVKSGGVWVPSASMSSGLPPAGTEGYLLQTHGTGAPSWEGITQSGIGAVERVWQDKARDIVNAADFGLLPSNTGAQNVTAWGFIMTFAASNPCTIVINRGTYDFNATIPFGPSNTRISGAGIDATILRCTFASGNFIANSGTVFYQTIDNLTITSSVTRTGGGMFVTGFWKRGLMYRVKISRHLHGLSFPQFETCTLSECFIMNPSGNGTGIYAGAPAATNQGAGLTIINCTIRGMDLDTSPTSPAVGLRGMEIYDVEAVYTVNTDFSGFTDTCVMMAPTTIAANHFFGQTYFDATVGGHNFTMMGAGTKLSINFDACWFAGAGASGAGAANCYGLSMANAGTYQDIIVSGCRFVTTSASGIFIATPSMAPNITGNTFINCGFNASSTNRNGITVSPASAASRTLNITGNYFESTNGYAVNLTTSNASGRVNLTGNVTNSGLSWPDGTYWGNVSGNTDTSWSPITVQVPSASTMKIPPIYNYAVVSGTTNINRIQPTYPGHIVVLRFIAVLTVLDDGNNLRLAGNLVTSSNTALTLVCEGNGDWREISRVAT